MSDSPSNSNVESKLETLKTAYKGRLSVELNKVEALLQTLDANPADQVSLAELRAKLHQLAGSSGTFGFEITGRQARRFEALIADCLAKADPSVRGEPLMAWSAQLSQAFADDSARVGTMGLERAESGNEINPVVWVVERDCMLSNYVGQQLNSFGFRVQYLEDASQLEDNAGSSGDPGCPALLLVDHRASQSPMLEQDPVGYWREILKGYDCPVIFTGAEESFDARLNAVRSGAQNYFAKPLDAPRIAASISRLLNADDHGPERVLIVEDDDALATNFCTVLEQAGMQARWLSDPQKLLRTVSEFSPEVILMDLRLPKARGVEMVKILGQFERWAELPIIYLSAESDPKARALAMIEGGDAFLEKPVSTELLVSTCRSRVKRLRLLQEAITLDGLTGLVKHSAIKDALQTEWEYALRHGTTFSVVMMDIDHFKSVNDTYGHAVGDLVIAAVGTLVRQHFRQTDKLGRYGGEEFALILPNCDTKTAVRLVDALRIAFSAIQFVGGGERFSCTLSAGVVDNQEYPESSSGELIAMADQMLYRAKRGGRNRVASQDG